VSCRLQRHSRAAHRQDAGADAWHHLDGGANARDVHVDRTVEGFQFLALDQFISRSR